MTNMTWKEFKDVVEEKLKSIHVKEDTEIWYIDITFPTKEDFTNGRVSVSFNTVSGIAIG
jgi:hypothetical protein